MSRNIFLRVVSNYLFISCVQDCFKCKTCSKTLEVANFKSLKGNVFCGKHYAVAGLIFSLASLEDFSKSFFLNSDRFNFGGLTRDSARVLKTARGKTARLVTARPAKSAAGSDAKPAEGEAKKLLKVIPKKGQPVRYLVVLILGNNSCDSNLIIVDSTPRLFILASREARGTRTPTPLC